MTDYADEDRIWSNKICPRYMDTHYTSWCQFAEAQGFDLDASDIEGPVLIRGLFKTSGWGLTAWSSNSTLR